MMIMAIDLLNLIKETGKTPSEIVDEKWEGMEKEIKSDKTMSLREALLANTKENK